MKMTLQELYQSINKNVITVYVIPRIELFSVHNPYLKLFYKDFFSADTQRNIRIISPHPLVPSFLFKRILGEQSIVHYHWIQFFKISGFFVLFWKMSCVLLYKLLGGKVIWSVHNKHLHSKKYLLLNNFFRKLMVKIADQLHVHCEEAAKVMAPILKVPEEKFVIIEHPMYPVTILDKNKAQQFCINNLVSECAFTQPVFLMYGNIGEYKGIAEVIPFFSEDTGQLIISGDCKEGEHRYLERIKSALVGRKNIHLVNRFLSKEEEIHLFNAVDCVLFNFQDMLTSGSIMLALSYEKEIIVPYIGCVKNLSGPGINTFTTPEELENLIKTFAEKNIQSNSIMKKYSIFALYLFLGEAIVRVCGFYANAYLGRTLGPEGYGLIIIGTSLLFYSLLISDAGLRILGILETAKPDEKRFFSPGELFTIKTFHGFLSFLVLFALTFILYSKTDEHAVRIICLYYLLNIFFDALFLDWYFKGLQRFGIVAIARLCGSLLYVIGISVYVKTSSDVTKVPWLFFATNMISVIVLFLAVRRTPFKGVLSFSLKKYRTIMGHSLPLGVGTLLNQVTVYLPPILLGKWAGISESGYLGAALKLVLLIMIIDKTFSTIFLSSLPRIWNANKENAKESLQVLLHCTLVIGFFISLVMSSLSEPVISLVFGDKYQSSSLVLSIISWFFTLTMINSIFAFGLIAIDQQKRYLKATIIGFVVNCIIIIALIRLYGIYGAAFAIVCGEFIFVLLCYHEFRKFSSLKFYIPFIKAAASGAGSWYLTLFITNNSYIQASIAGTLFIVFSAGLQLVTKNDIRFLIAKWKKN